MQQKPLHIYRASAGSGKTFLLASNYLLLLFQHPYKYREILAVTFTNKATDEMKTRILGELKKLAQGQPSLYGEQITHHFPALKGETLQARADEIYRLILHDYSRFAVGTIDGFVQQIIRAFAYEIGLNAGYELQLNESEVKEDLAQRLFALIDTNESLRSWITELALELIDEGKSWKFTEAMLSLAGEIFKEKFADFEKNIREMDDPDASFLQLRQQLKQSIVTIEQDLKAIANKALLLIEKNGLHTSDFKGGANGFANHFNKLLKEVAEPTKTTRAVIDQLPAWTTKTTDSQIRNSIESVYPELNDLLKQAIDYFDQHSETYFTSKQVFQHFDNLNLLRILADQLGDYRRETNSLLISDTHSLLRELTRDNDAPFIFEKTGNRFHHFLLDEFQDTSTFQWQNFKPLLQQSIAENHYNLLVGDVKQAIYRWRNGDWRLLLNGVQQGYQAEQLNEGSLQENYRSAPEIIAFNNAFFGAAPELLQQQFNTELENNPAVAELLRQKGFFTMINEAYHETRQETPAQAKLGGAVAVRLFDPGRSRSNDWQEPALAQVAIDIETMIVDQQVTPGGIAVLTRNNGEARRIIDYLLQYQQSTQHRCRYPILSADALQLSNSPAIQLLMAAINLLLDPSNAIARAELVQANAIRLHQNLSDPGLYKKNQEKMREQLPENFNAKFDALRWASLFDATETLIQVFELDHWSSEQAFLLHFRDIVNSFSKNGKSTFRDFVDWWNDDNNKKALPSAGGDNAVQVMTIHKSKGLAFDAVVVPFADWKLENDKGNIWCYFPNETPLKWVPVRLSAKLAKTAFAADYHEEQLLSIMDALNLLYVAFTRARRQLRLYAPQPTATATKLSTTGQLIAKVLGYHEAPADPWFAKTAWLADAWLQDGYQPLAAKTEVATNTLTLLPKTSSEGPAWLHQPAPEEWLLETASSKEQTLGKLLHLALERIPHHRQLNKELQRMVAEGWLTQQQLPDFKDKLEKVLMEPTLARWYKGDYQVISERPILLQGGSIKRPDKVFYNNQETILIDFKFTRTATATHAKQLEEYKDLLEQMGYPHVQAYLYYGRQEALVPLQQMPREQGKLFN